VEDDGAKDAKPDGKKVEKEVRVILQKSDGDVIRIDPKNVIELQGDLLNEVKLEPVPKVVLRLQEAGQENPKTRKLKDLEAATKKLQEAAKQAGADLPEETKKQLEELQKQVEKIRKQTEEEMAKVREQVRGDVLKARLQAQGALQLADDAKRHAYRVQVLSRFGHTRLGAHAQPPDETLAAQLDLPKGQGMVVAAVAPDSPAAKAGIQAHDILVEFNGKAVSSNTAEFVKAVQEVKADTSVDAVVLRKGKKTAIKGIVLPERKEGEGDNFFWMEKFPNFTTDNAVWMKNFKPEVFKYAPDFKTQAFAFGGGPNSVSTTVIRNNDRFTSRHHDGSLTISITGTITGNETKPSEILIKDGNSELKYDHVDKVPEKHRDKVRKLLEMTEKGAAKAEAKSSKEE